MWYRHIILEFGGGLVSPLPCWQHCVYLPLVAAASRCRSEHRPAGGGHIRSGVNRSHFHKWETKKDFHCPCPLFPFNVVVVICYSGPPFTKGKELNKPSTLLLWLLWLITINNTMIRFFHTIILIGIHVQNNEWIGVLAWATHLRRPLFPFPFVTGSLTEVWKVQRTLSLTIQPQPLDSSSLTTINNQQSFYQSVLLSTRQRKNQQEPLLIR